MAKFIWKQKQAHFKHGHSTFDISCNCIAFAGPQDSVVDLGLTSTSSSCKKLKVHYQTATVSKPSSDSERQGSNGKKNVKELSMNNKAEMNAHSKPKFKSKSASIPATAMKKKCTKTDKSANALNNKEVEANTRGRPKPNKKVKKRISTEARQQEGESVCSNRLTTSPGKILMEEAGSTNEITNSIVNETNGPKSTDQRRVSCANFILVTIGDSVAMPTPVANGCATRYLVSDTIGVTVTDEEAHTLNEESKNVFKSSTDLSEPQAETTTNTHDSSSNASSYSITSPSGTIVMLAGKTPPPVDPRVQTAIASSTVATTDVASQIQQSAIPASPASNNKCWLVGPAAQTGGAPAQPGNDIRKIPRPCNAFFIFANEFRTKFLRTFPSLTNSDISRRLGNAWRAMTDEEKGRYYEQARVIAKEHTRRYPNYSYTPHRKYAKRPTADRPAAVSSSSSSSCQPTFMLSSHPPPPHYLMPAKNILPVPPVPQLRLPSLHEIGEREVEINDDDFLLLVRKQRKLLGGSDEMLGQSASRNNIMKTMTLQVSDILPVSQNQTQGSVGTIPALPLPALPNTTASSMANGDLQEYWTLTPAPRLIGNICTPSGEKFASIQKSACGDGQPCSSETSSDQPLLLPKRYKLASSSDSILNTTARLPVNSQQLYQSQQEATNRFYLSRTMLPEQIEVTRCTAEQAGLLQAHRAHEASSTDKKRRGRPPKVSVASAVQRPSLGATAAGSFPPLLPSHQASCKQAQPRCIASVSELGEVLTRVLKDRALSSAVDVAVDPGSYSSASVLVSLNMTCVEELCKKLTSTSKEEELCQSNQVTTGCSTDCGDKMETTDDDTVVKVTIVSKNSSINNLHTRDEGHDQGQLNFTPRAEDITSCSFSDNLEVTDQWQNYSNVQMISKVGKETTAIDDLSMKYQGQGQDRAQPSCKQTEEHFINNLPPNDFSLKDQIQCKGQSQMGQGDASSATCYQCACFLPLRHITCHCHLPLPVPPMLMQYR